MHAKSLLVFVLLLSALASLQLASAIPVCEESRPASGPVAYEQGLRYNDTPVKESRSDPVQGLGLERGRNEANFFSLGFGGWITVAFDEPVRNGEGIDLGLVEETWGRNLLERADIYASADGENWTYLGVADNLDNSLNQTFTGFDLGALGEARYVRINDTSNKTEFWNDSVADGYDLNAVLALGGCDCGTVMPVITSVTPGVPAPGDAVIVNGTLNGTETGLLFVNGRPVFVTNGTWSVTLAATDAGELIVNASFEDLCGRIESDSGTVLVSVPVRKHKSGGGAKQCDRGWHREDDRCVRDEAEPGPEAEPDPVDPVESAPAQPVPPATQPQPVAAAPEPASAPEPVQPARAPPEEMLTGNVTGNSSGANLWWLIGAAALVVIGLSVAGAMRKR